MKKLLLLLFLLPVFCDAQINPKLKTLNDCVSLSCYDGLEMELYNLLKTANHAPKTKDQVKSDFQNLIDTSKKNTGNLTLFKSHRLEIINYLSELDNFGDSPALFFYSSYLNLPFEFANFNQGLCFYQSRISYGSVFNTLKTTPQERAVAVAKGSILPALSSFLPLLKSKDISYIGITITYASKDFSDDSDRKTECITAIVPKLILIKYANAELTDKEVFTKCIFYNHDRNMKSDAIKKIDLSQ